jgi:hypothetical protein
MGRKRTCDVGSDTLEYYRLYYHAHNEQIVCECGSSVKKFGIYQHRKGKGHLIKLELARLNGLLNIQNTEIVETKTEESLVAEQTKLPSVSLGEINTIV